MVSRRSSEVEAYSAKNIEVLEGLEPVRRRPAMYIGGTDEHGLHHLAAEVIDNAMDEIVNGFGDCIEVELLRDGALRVSDNGRGIPVDPHPKFKSKSALEVILTTLHSGGKFGGKAYHTAGGLHGVGISVVNALADKLDIEVTRNDTLWRQSYVQGRPMGKLTSHKGARNKRGTTVIFRPDPEVFGHEVAFRPALLYQMVRSKAYLFSGVKICWKYAESLHPGDPSTPDSQVLHFPGGLQDLLADQLGERGSFTPKSFSGRATFSHDRGHVEWVVAWPDDGKGALHSYCNTVPTPDGGAHETGLRAALTKGLKAYGELAGNRRAGLVNAEDVLGSAEAVLSVFLRDPQFHGQTKQRLVNADAGRPIENALRDHFEHWLSEAPNTANKLLEYLIERAEERLRRREHRDVARKTAVRKLRLPSKLADCTEKQAGTTEIFIVEGDSAGGSAKQARNRRIQAVLPLRGKILNVASAKQSKFSGNQELSNLVQALGCGTGEGYKEGELRYERVIIMTDADVDGAHIAALLMTFFFREMRKLIENGHLYLALPPLYRLTRGDKTHYARDEAHKGELLETVFGGNGKVEISRFKGLGEMPSGQLRDTTMSPATRNMLRIIIPEKKLSDTNEIVECLMGRKPELRLAFIQDGAGVTQNLDI